MDRVEDGQLPDFGDAGDQQRREQPQESLSRVMAYDWFGSLALEPLGLALIGPLAAGIGTSTTLWVTAAVVLFCQLAVILVPSVRRLESRPGATGPPLPPRPIEASVGGCG